MLGGVHPEDHGVWTYCLSDQVEALGTCIVRPFRDGLDLLHLVASRNSRA